MKKRKPTARDRDIADYLFSLHEGKHFILVEGDFKPVVKAEGGLVLFSIRPWVNLTVLPERA